MRIILAESEYLDKVRGCWLGKNIGGTLGGPYEGRMEVLNLKFYDPVPEKPLPNDDLDLQLVWLHALRTRGINITCHDLAEEWLDHIVYPFNEYGYGSCNLRKGLKPPLSGRFNNWYINGMGASIRSEIWALIAPASPSVAVEYAYNDAVVDHSEDGMYGELFLAALESAAFVESDIYKLLEIGLSVIPESSRLSHAVRDTIRWYEEGLDWLSCRQKIVEKYGHYDMTDVPQNHAFIVLGWLYGDSFGDKICKAVNCGYDTDCTGATLASILGIINGAEGIPEEWKAPIAEEIVVGWGIKNLRYETDLESLVQSTYEVAKQVVAAKCSHVEISPQTSASDLSALNEVDWLNLDSARRVSSRSPYVDTRQIRDLIVDIDYQGLPTVTYIKPKRFSIRLTNRTVKKVSGTLRVSVPSGWEVTPAQPQPFDLQVKESTEFHFKIVVPEERVKIEVSNWVHVEIQGMRHFSSAAFDFVLIGESLWFVKGPLEGSGEEALSTVYRAERMLDGSGTIKDPLAFGFQLTTFPENEFKIEKWFDGRPGVMYAYTSINCPEERKVKIGVICNDGIKVWLNGKVIIESHRHVDIPPVPHAKPNGLIKEERLKDGWNNILLKVVRCNKPIFLNLFTVDTVENGSQGFVDLTNTYLPVRG